MQSINAGDQALLSAREAAARLGIKLDSLYAYVSRGLLRSIEVPGTRERHYRAADVERVRIGRGGDKARETVIPVIGSAICLIDGGRFYYRGVDALCVAADATLEAAADLLWGEDAASATAWAPEGARGRNALPENEPTPPGSLIERCQMCLAALAAQDLGALDLTRPGLVRTGRTILAALVETIAGVDAGGEPIHRQLAAAWRLDTAGGEVLRRCLVLLADHELNASTFVARCVASTGATPYAVVIAALSALSGRRHGGASARAEALFQEIAREALPVAAMAARLARGESIPGIGHPLYPDGDPRSLAIVEALAAASPEAGSRVAAMAAGAVRLTGDYPNVDFALGAAMTALGAPPGSALSVFLVARTVGWIAHAIEQYESTVLIRPRARYTGPRPVGGRR